MKYIIYTLFILQISFAQNVDYIKIKDDIYTNKKNELFLKVFLSQRNNNAEYFISVVYLDSFENPEGIKVLKEVLDLKTFRKIKNKSNFYKDKNHIYEVKIMYDSATLSIVK